MFVILSYSNPPVDKMLYGKIPSLPLIIFPIDKKKPEVWKHHVPARYLLRQSSILNFEQDK